MSYMVTLWEWPSGNLKVGGQGKSSRRGDVEDPGSGIWRKVYVPSSASSREVLYDSGQESITAHMKVCG